ncbi:hypothetical protein PR202_gb25029 [Eleusine coracana subsp. coracana]|uniref:Uncharacterized protein n=1 Tax=Eleusine coracana subsp. coracana TaxID=191504 RepID=A0AAV5FKA4_ELECO|nr:hypothetical protein PR202_gb25029 [Eleusine coracana subsp. coracana]
MDMEVNNNRKEKEETAAVIERSLSAVTYCCGACGYDLRLRSSDRNTAGGMVVGRRGGGGGVVSFDAIDDARFGHAEEFRCVDVRARRLFCRRTRLLCRDCGASIGFGYDDRTASPRYDIRIRKLQPLLLLTHGGDDAK